MRTRWLLLFLLPILITVEAKLQYHEPTTKCVINNRNYWDTFAAHFSEASLVTINILHVDDYHNSMSFLVDLVFRYTHVFTKLKKAVSVKHTPLSTMENGRMDDVDGRSAYLIITWNERVLTNFLNLIPDGVVRDRRAKYVILFAYSIRQFCYEFDRQNAHVLARFWKQFGIVDVCIHIPCSCHANNVYQYHPFLRQIKVLNVTDLQKNPTELTISLKDLHRYPLKVSMFERKPTALKAAHDPLMKYFPKMQRHHSYGGVDGMIIHSLADFLNFRPMFVETDYYKYGRVLENGTAVGSLGDVVYRRAHIAGNGRFVEDYGTDAIEFSLPYSNDYICFVVPKSQKIPQWIMLFHCFSPMSWATLITVFLLSSFIWKVLRGRLLTFYAIFINTSTILSSLSKVQKLFLVFCLSYNLIISGIFQGSLTTSYSTVSYYPDITTLEALASSRLTISSNLDVWKDDNSTIAAALKNKQRFTNGERALERAAIVRDVAAVERRLDAIYYIQEQFLDENGSPLIHIVEECVTAHFISFIVPKGSPFLKKFNLVIRMLNEAGLPKKWYDDIAKSVVLSGKMPALKKNDEDKVVSLNDVQTAFYILVMGLTASSLVFLHELWNKRKRIINPAPHEGPFDFVH